MWKPTYDTFDTKEAAEKDAARRTKSARANGINTQFAVRKTSGGKYHREQWTVMYKER